MVSTFKKKKSSKKEAVELFGQIISEKLCARGKAAAKRKFDVYPSAYANMYASAVCSGKVKPGGKKKNEETVQRTLAKTNPELARSMGAERARQRAKAAKHDRAAGQGTPTAEQRPNANRPLTAAGEPRFTSRTGKAGSRKVPYGRTT